MLDQISHLLTPSKNERESWMKCLSRYFGQSFALPLHVLVFRYVAPFRNQSASKAMGSKIEAKFRTLFRTFREGMSQFYDFGIVPDLRYTSDGMVWYGMVYVNLYSAIVANVSNALGTLVPGKQPPGCRSAAWKISLGVKKRNKRDEKTEDVQTAA